MSDRENKLPCPWTVDELAQFDCDLARVESEGRIDLFEADFWRAVREARNTENDGRHELGMTVAGPAARRLVSLLGVPMDMATAAYVEARYMTRKHIAQDLMRQYIAELDERKGQRKSTADAKLYGRRRA